MPPAIPLATYRLQLTPAVGDGQEDNDAYSFWVRGIPAVLLIESTGELNPYYHSTGDTVDRMNAEFFAEQTKAALADVAHAGCLADSGWGPVAGTVRAGAGADPVSGAEVVLSEPAWGFELVTTTDAAGAFQIVAPGTPGLITVKASGHRDYAAVVIAVGGGSTTTIDVVLDAAYLYLPLVHRN